MIALCVLNGITQKPIPLAYALSGVCAVIAGILLFNDLRLSAKLQVSVLFGLGAVLLLYAHQRGIPISLVDAVSRNTFLLTMIMSVGFLKLLLDIDTSNKPLPRGRLAYLNTLLSLGFFGSVINISAPIMICDRLEEEQPVDLFTASASTRVFCLCSSWSPYFGGAAFVLTYVSGVHLSEVMATGLPLLLIGIAMVFGFSLIARPQRVQNFAGYPMSVSKLWVPIVLTLCVLAAQAVLPNLSILIVIALSSLLLTIMALINRLGGIAGAKVLAEHIATGLPRGSNELLLFLAAGVLATGLTAYVATTDYQLTLTRYTWQTASILLAGMIGVAALGIHPIILISALTPLLLPIGPDPELLAITYLFAWALGTAASPLSGTHMIFQGRYGIPAWKGALNNWPFVAVMYAVAVALLRWHVTVFQV